VGRQPASDQPATCSSMSSASYASPENSPSPDRHSPISAESTGARRCPSTRASAKFRKGTPTPPVQQREMQPSRLGCPTRDHRLEQPCGSTSWSSARPTRHGKLAAARQQNGQLTTSTEGPRSLLAACPQAPPT